MLNVLVIFNKRQMYTNSTYDFVDSFSKYSKNKIFYYDWDVVSEIKISLSKFDVIILHWSSRLIIEDVNNVSVNFLKDFNGLKIIFIQDEYLKPKTLLNRLTIIKFDIIYSVGNKRFFNFLYPRKRLKYKKIREILTGYNLEIPKIINKKLIPPSQRKIFFAYRARKLPLFYGKLGYEKYKIGLEVFNYCKKNNIKCDIDMFENSRIYGDKWYKFLLSSKSTLISESCSNVYDFNNELEEKIKEEDILKYEDPYFYNMIRKYEIDDLLSSGSPKIFESAMTKTVIVAYDGKYQGIIKKNKHFIELKKDHSNLNEIVNFLKNDDKINKMAEFTFKDLIQSNKYSYLKMINRVDLDIKSSIKKTRQSQNNDSFYERNKMIYLEKMDIEARKGLSREEFFVAEEKRFKYRIFVTIYVLISPFKEFFIKYKNNLIYLFKYFFK